MKPSINVGKKLCSNKTFFLRANIYRLVSLKKILIRVYVRLHHMACVGLRHYAYEWKENEEELRDNPNASTDYELLKGRAEFAEQILDIVEYEFGEEK